MEEEKKEIRTNLSTILLFIAIVIIVAMGVYIYTLKKDDTSKIQSQVDNLDGIVNDLQEKINSMPETGDTGSKDEASIQNKTLEEANVTKSINKEGSVGEITYKIGNAATNHLEGFDVKLENSKVFFKLTDKEKIESYYITDSTINREENKEEEITGFNGKVKNVYYYQVGQAVDPDCLAILFLMEDGRIEYISLVDALQTTNLKSRGEIEGIYNIAKIYSASAYEKFDEEGGSGWASCVAQDSNKNYYSLEIAFEKNNIDLSKVN